MNIRMLTESELVPDLLSGFCHRQHITRQWMRENGVWTLVRADLLREWDDEKRQWIPHYLRTQCARGGVALGAFEGARLTGFAALDGVRYDDILNLTLLFVDDRWQRRGMGAALFGEACRAAAKRGARSLFISAIPDASTIAFYQRMGCIDCAAPIAEFIDSPLDRSLIYNLTNQEDIP